MIINKIRGSIGLTEAPAKVSISVEIRMLEKFGKDINQCSCWESGRLETVYDTRERKIRKQVLIQSFAPG